MPKGKAYKGRSNAAKRWLPEHDDQILDLWLAELPLKPLADKLQRTVKALERRVWALATCYRGIMYKPISRQSRAGQPNTERDQTVLGWVKKHSGMEQGCKIWYAARMLGRKNEEIERMMGLRKEQKGFGI